MKKQSRCFLDRNKKAQRLGVGVWLRGIEKIMRSIMFVGKVVEIRQRVKVIVVQDRNCFLGLAYGKVG